MIVNLKKPWDMQLKRKYLILRATGTLCDDELQDDDDGVEMHHTKFLDLMVEHTCLTSDTFSLMIWQNTKSLP